MRASQNQLERFRCIAKKLVDEHSAEFFTWSSIRSSGVEKMPDEVFSDLLNALGRELNENAEMFIGSQKTVNEEVKSEIWQTCKKYIENFVRRNKPASC